MTPKIQILSCGNDPALLQTREWLLVHAGFAVTTVASADILRLPEHTAFNLAVLGHSIPENEQDKVAELIQIRWPGIKVLCLTMSDVDVHQISDCVFRGSSLNPGAFISACNKVLDWPIKRETK